MALKVELLYGFSSISWTEEPRDSILSNGYELFKAGHVINVKEIRVNEKPTEIVGDCIKQTSIRDAAYHVNLWIDKDRKITSAHCQCVAGESGQCKHTSALVFYVNEEREESKTDVQCKFVAPSKAGQNKYPKGQELDDIFKFKEKCPVFNWKNKPLSAKEQQCKWMEEAKNTSNPLYRICKNREELARKSQVVATAERQKVDTNILPQWFYEKVFANSNEVDLNNNLSGELKISYERHVQVSPQVASDICMKTTSQSSSASWKRFREIRITSSRAHSIWRGRKKETRYSHFVSTPSGNIPALKYGRDMEDIARRKYEEITGKSVFVPGLVIKPEKSWLGASPDGAFINDDGNLKLVEIKCPYSAKESDNIDVPFLDKEDQLKKTHQYYTQVQLAMYCCNASACDFFVFSPKDYKLLTVPFDHDFI